MIRDVREMAVLAGLAACTMADEPVTEPIGTLSPQVAMAQDDPQVAQAIIATQQRLGFDPSDGPNGQSSIWRDPNGCLHVIVNIDAERWIELVKTPGGTQICTANA